MNGGLDGERELGREPNQVVEQELEESWSKRMNENPVSCFSTCDPDVS